MKKVAIAVAVLLVVGVGLLIGLKPYGFDMFGVRGVLDADGALVYKKAEGFLAALKYKDFKTAARYHTWADEQKADIPKLIERLFGIKPEQLNIQDIKITQVDFDEGHRRARTHFTAICEALNTAQNDEDENDEKEVEGILYWHKRPTLEDDPPPPEAEAESEDAQPAPSPSATPNPSESPHLPTRLEGEDEEQWFLMLESSLHN